MELESEIAKAAKTAERAENLYAEMDELSRKGDEQRVRFELELAGARDVKTAWTLLANHGNDIKKLKATDPWLLGENATMRRLRKIACLDGETKTFNYERGIKMLA